MRLQLHVKRSKRQACPDFVPIVTTDPTADNLLSVQIKFHNRNKELKFLTVVKRDKLSLFLLYFIKQKHFLTPVSITNLSDNEKLRRFIKMH